MKQKKKAKGNSHAKIGGTGFNVEVIEKCDRKQRAEECTKYLQDFDSSVRNWLNLAKVIAEVEDEELFLEVGCKSVDEWIRKHAPVSYRLAYMRRAQYRVLSPHFTDEELAKFPPETASWAAKAKHISPAEFKKPLVREALCLPRQKAVRAIQEAVPDGHVEDSVRVVCKFAASQAEAVKDAHEAFKLMKDAEASLEDFVEFCVSEWMESAWEGGESVRQYWESTGKAASL